jgi:signal peptidase II
MERALNTESSNFTTVPEKTGSPAERKISTGTILFLLMLGSVVCILDQLSKAWVLASLTEGQIVEVVPGIFNLTLAFNRGAAFGIMSDFSDQTRHLLLALTTVLALTAVMYFLYYDYLEDRVAQSALGLILGGAFGNIIDRLRLGEVVDFLDVYYGTYHWPAFNVADSAICVGVFILLFRKPARSS